MHKVLRRGVVVVAMFGSIQAFAFGSAPKAPDLCDSIAKGDVNAVQADLNQGDKVVGTTCELNGNKYSPLWYELALARNANTCPSADLITVLARNGANVNEPLLDNSLGMSYATETPLTYAMSSGLVSTASQLVDLGADPMSLNCGDCQAVSAYGLVLQNTQNQQWLDLFMKLLDHGMTLGNYPLDSIQASGDFWVTVASTLEKKYPNKPLFDEALAYVFAQRGATSAQLDWTISRGLRFDVVASGNSMTAFQAALEQQSLAFVQLLMSKTNVTIANSDFFHLVKNSNADLLDFGLKSLPDASAVDATGQTPLMILLQAGSAMQYVQDVLAKKQNFNAERQQEPSTALEIAAQSSSTDVLDALLAAGADPEYVSNSAHQTPLLVALAARNTANAEILLKLSEKVINQTNSSGQNALTLAAYGGSTALVEEIAAVPGVNVNAADGTGQTALMYAVQANSVPTVVALLTRGACIRTENPTGHTALSMAYDSNYSDVLSVLNIYLQQPNHC